MWNMSLPLAEFVAKIVTQTQCLCFFANWCTLSDCVWNSWWIRPILASFASLIYHFRYLIDVYILWNLQIGCMQFGSLFACSIGLKYMGIYTCKLKMCAIVPRAMRGSNPDCSWSLKAVQAPRFNGSAKAALLVCWIWQNPTWCQFPPTVLIGSTIWEASNGVWCIYYFVGILIHEGVLLSNSWWF